MVQHNTVWVTLFGFIKDNQGVTKTVQRKVRRLFYNEITRMNYFPNMKGARILGFCLNVTGLQSHKDKLPKNAYPLARVAQAWTQRNYLALRKTHPPVAEAVLMDGLSFDGSNNRLVKTGLSSLTGIPSRQYLQLR